MGRGQLRAFTAAGVLACAVQSMRAEIEGNPYRTIAERNAFGLRPPQPPPEPAKPPEAPKPPPNVLFTGFSDFGDGKTAYLMVTPPGSNSPKYLALAEGQEENDIAVINIDMANETVRIRVQGNEVTLNYKDNGNKVGGGAGSPQPTPVPGRPGVPGAYTAPSFTLPPPGGSSSPSSGPVMIRRGGKAEVQAAPVTVPPSFSAGNIPTPVPIAQPGGSGGVYVPPNSPAPQAPNVITTPDAGATGPVIINPKTGRPTPLPPPIPGTDYTR